jgi:hypothetical protein
VQTHSFEYKQLCYKPDEPVDELARRLTLRVIKIGGPSINN